MKLKEAAYIIGKMGGRPAINKVEVQGKTQWTYRGGNAPAVVVSNWILATNFWRDTGVWIDTETWND